jgi:hypothetical protein
MDMYNLEELLVQQNPHWLTRQISRTGFIRDAFDNFCQHLLTQKLIVTLSGPRRSGKTFLMQQSMGWLSENHNISLANICYFQFSGSQNDKQIISGIVDIFCKKYAEKGQKYIFLDEVQYIDYWQDQLKSIYDLSPDLKFVLSGSTSLFYRQKSHESLAGRLIKYQLGALNFREYCRFKNIVEPSQNRAQFISNLPIYRTEFKKYLASGQYPELVVNPDIDSQKYLTDLADQLINYDIPYFAKNIDRQTFLSVVKTLSFDLSEEFSANNLAKTLGVDRRTISEYVKILEETGLFHVCYNYGLSSMRKKLSGSKKIYSLNLNLALHLNGFDISYFNDTRVYGRYFENYVYLRLLERKGKVEYYRMFGKELDFIADDLLLRSNLPPHRPRKYQK